MPRWLLRQVAALPRDAGAGLAVGLTRTLREWVMPADAAGPASPLDPVPDAAAALLAAAWGSAAAGARAPSAGGAAPAVSAWRGVQAALGCAVAASTRGADPADVVRMLDDVVGLVDRGASDAAGAGGRGAELAGLAGALVQATLPPPPAGGGGGPAGAGAASGGEGLGRRAAELSRRVCVGPLTCAELVRAERAEAGHGAKMLARLLGAGASRHGSTGGSAPVEGRGEGVCGGWPGVFAVTEPTAVSVVAALEGARLRGDASSVDRVAALSARGAGEAMRLTRRVRATVPLASPAALGEVVSAHAAAAEAALAAGRRSPAEGEPLAGGATEAASAAGPGGAAEEALQGARQAMVRGVGLVAGRLPSGALRGQGLARAAERGLPACAWEALRGAARRVLGPGGGDAFVSDTRALAEDAVRSVAQRRSDGGPRRGAGAAEGARGPGRGSSGAGQRARRRDSSARRAPARSASRGSERR